MLEKFWNFKNTSIELFRGRSGSTAIEYGLIAVVLSVALIGGYTALGNGVGSMFNNVAETLDE